MGINLSYDNGLLTAAYTKLFTYLFVSILFLTSASAQNGWTTYNTSNSGLSGDSVNCVYIDSAGSVWFGTSGGASKFDGSKWTTYNSGNSLFTSESTVQAIAKYKGSLYFGVIGSSSLVKFDGTNWTAIPGLGPEMILSMDADSSGNLWIGTMSDGVYKYDGTNFTHYSTSNSVLPSNNITCVKTDKNGNVWLAMVGSYYSYTPAGIAKFNGTSWQIFNSTNSALTNENVHSLLVDKKGNLWCSTDSLLLFKYDGTNWSRFDLSDQISSDWFTCLAEDSSGNIWAGLCPNASERGIVEYDGVKATYFGQQQGFPSQDQVVDMKIDKYNNKWIGSYIQGVFEFNNEPKISFANSITGDSLKSTTFFNIQWNSSFVNNVNLDYSTDDGNTWQSIISNAPAYWQIYNWSIPVVAPYSNKCKIRISDASDSKLFAVSDSTFTIYAKVAALNVTPGGGTQNNPVTVSITCSTDSADIHYTIDGSTPTQNSQKYTSPFYINKNTIVKAIAYKKDWQNSDPVSSSYYMRVGNIILTPSPGIYSLPQVVTISTATDSAIIYYTLDGTPATKNSAIYTQPISINKNTTVNAAAYRINFDSSYVSGNYTLSSPIMTAVIKTDTVWVDSNFKGYAAGTLDGSGSTISYDSIYAYIWLVNGDSAGSGPKINVKLKTGTNQVKLLLYNPRTYYASTTVYVNVYAAEMKTNGGIFSAPAQLDTNAFLVTSADDKVYRFDSTGTINWNILTGGQIQSTTCISDQNHIYVGSTDTRIYSFDQNGVPLWDKALGGIITSSPSAGSNGDVYVGISTGRIYDLNGSGTVMWTVQTGGAIVSSPSVSSSGDVYFGSCDGKLYSVDKSGRINWAYTTGDSIVSSPALGNDSSIIFGSNDGSIYKLNYNGVKEWSNFENGKVKSSPIIIDSGKIVVGRSNGEVVCLSKDGNVLWRYYTGSPVNGTAAISDNGQILIGDDSGTLYSLSEQGSLLWYFKTGSAINSPVLITDNGLALFGNMNGEVYTLKLNQAGKINENQASYDWPTFKGNNARNGNKNKIITGIKNDKQAIVKAYQLSQNYPNPFNPSTVINYSVPKTGMVTIKIYDVLGREVQTIVNDIKSSGNYSVVFNAGKLSSGVYYYRMQAGSFADSKKFILLK